MNKANEHKDASNTREQITANLIPLSDNLTKSDLLNQEMLDRIQHELLTYDDKPTEKQLWEAIASSCSPEWRAAWANFLDAEAQWKFLNSPKEVSLGLIGDALDSHETGIARESYNDSLVNFTFKNEELIQDTYINELLKTLLEQTRILEQSKENTNITQTATDTMADMDSTGSEKTIQTPSAQEKNTSPLSQIFNKLQKWGLLEQKKETFASSAPAPSLPES